MENMSEDRGKNMAKKRQIIYVSGCWPCRCRKDYTGREHSLSYRQYSENGKGGSPGHLSGLQIPWNGQEGITIFSKQAGFRLGEKSFTLLDTPGHVDFSAEMERTLRVLDYAILVINGADGVQGHTETLWKLLKQYRIPAFCSSTKWIKMVRMQRNCWRNCV